ncbi:MAG: acetate--CoA ligase [Bdellovibrionaceae bacterium]|nr:acetate--CoA ligase [Pseudobdellovibrionaceae bacterium]|tara:strand:- start:39098 stop:40945 length:1848 start_codon:yes stop_codon:yes gene_type:complete
MSDHKAFWEQESKNIDWVKPPTKGDESTYHKPVKIQWFEDGQLNVTYNCIDRHLPKLKDKVAYFYEPDHPDQERKEITYGQLHEEVGRFANILKSQGVQKGDRVTIYMPMIPEAAFAMLACARIGAVHSVVFGGFSADSLAHRILDGKSEFVITADEGRRGGKIIPLKKNVDEALKQTPQVKKVLMVRHTGNTVPMDPTKDLIYEDLRAKASTDCPPETMNAEDPLFILYTSGSTGKPKGVLHTTGGYLVYANSTFRRIFDYKENDVYWCSADIGWITGHTYMVYGPLSHGASSVFFEGVPNYPSPSRFWEEVDRYKVTIFYTAPTAIRALMREGNDYVTRCKRSSLRILGTVGEPINPEVWEWYNKVVGDGRCYIVDTWWQTETGGAMISPTPPSTPLKPGSATFPLEGIEAKLLTAEGKEIEGEGEGLLVITQSWPGQARTIYGNHERFEQGYFSTFEGCYFTGDGCKRDKDGFYWITGRVDDVINVSGHRLGTAELESAIVSLDEVSEAAVVGVAHDLKGQGIYAYVTLKAGVEPSDELKKKVIQQVSTKVSPIAKPDFVQWAPALPKTRSGKIMRRILRKIGEGETQNFGDTSTLADPKVVEDLVQERSKM